MSSRAQRTRPSARTPPPRHGDQGSKYAPLGHTDFSTIVGKVRAADADAVFNTLNGDSNGAFFKEYRNAGLTAERMPVMSVSIAEEEVSGIGVENLKGQLTAWNYYQTAKSSGLISTATGRPFRVMTTRSW